MMPSLRQHTSLMFIAFVTRVLLQAGYFLVIARSLEVQEFGALVSALALTSLAVPFAGAGAGFVLVARSTRRPETTRRYIGNALVLVGTTGPLLICAVAGLTHLLVPQLPLALVLILGIADLLFARLIDISAQAYQAQNEMRAVSLLVVLPLALRFVAAVGFALAPIQHSAIVWASIYLVSTMLGSAVACAASLSRFGLPQPHNAFAKSDVVEGVLFSVGASSAVIYADIDKTLLARLTTFSIAGYYAAGYRVVAMAMLPIQSLLAVTFPRFLRLGRAGVAGSLSLARTVLPLSLAYAAVVSVLLFIMAPIVPTILGADYAGAVAAIRWLAPLPVLQTLAYLPGDVLTGADHQGSRSLCQLLTAILNAVLCVLLIPAYGMAGAAVATIAAYAALAISLWLLVFIRLHGGQQMAALRSFDDTHAVDGPRVT